MSFNSRAYGYRDEDYLFLLPFMDAIAWKAEFPGNLGGGPLV